MSVKQYLERLAQEANLDEASKAIFLKVIGDEKLLKPLDDGFLRQEDYSRSMDTLAKSRTEFETQQKTWRDWYAEATTRDAERESELQTLRAKVNGNPNPNPNPNPAPTGLTKKEIEEREGRMINIVKQGMRLASRHAAKFGEELDVDALEKIAVERGLTLDLAYDQYIAPRVQAATKLAQDEAVKKAREEGIQEGLSKRDVPSEGDRGFHPLFRPKPSDAAHDPSKLSERQRADNFASAWATEAAKK
jgi:hypothetical protein